MIIILQFLVIIVAMIAIVKVLHSKFKFTEDDIDEKGNLKK